MPLDQYYTPQEVADFCIKKALSFFPDSQFLEPSEGFGAFSLPLIEIGKSVIGYDIDPKLPHTIKQDFLTVSTNVNNHVAIGNPPFGFRCSQVIRFFNHCADIGCNSICFIVPLSMRKEQYIEKLNQYFHLIYDSRELGTFDNTHVRTCFQIWERRSYPRKTRRVLNTSNANKHYKFVRVGTKIGLYHIEDEVKHHKIVKLPQVKNLDALNRRIREFSKTTTSSINSISINDIYNLLGKQNMKTITKSMLSTITADDFNIGLLMADSARRREFVQIDVDDIDELVARLNEVRDYVLIEKDNQQKKAAETLQALTDNDVVRSLIGDFGSIEALLEAVSGFETKKPARDTTRTSTTSNSKIFHIELYDAVSGKTIRGKSVNKKLSTDIENSEAYKTLLKKDPSMTDFDSFMRKYSPEYSNEYQLNAKYNGKEFHINARGKLNSHAMIHFEDFKKKDKTGADDKVLLHKFKEKVLTV